MSWRQQPELSAALSEIVGGAVALVIDDVGRCQATLEAAEATARQRAIERWGAADAWRAFAPGPLLRLERTLATWGNG